MTSRPPAPDGSIPAIYLVALDDGALKTKVLDMACGLGAALGGPAELHILHVSGSIPAPTALSGPSAGGLEAVLDAGRQLLAHAKAHADERFHGSVFTHLEGGQPWRTIMQMASNLSADLIVLGTDGHSGAAPSALGSVTEKVMRLAGCPVLVVRAKDYESYVGEGITPACPDCIAVRATTARAKLWCDRHSTHHPSAILHYDSATPFAVGSSLLRPA